MKFTRFLRNLAAIVGSNIACFVRRDDVQLVSIFLGLSLFAIMLYGIGRWVIWLGFVQEDSIANPTVVGCVVVFCLLTTIGVAIQLWEFCVFLKTVWDKS